MWFVVPLALLVLISFVLKPRRNGLANTNAWAAGFEAFKKGNDLFSKKRMQEALECFDDAIKCGYVDDADAYMNRGICLQSLHYDLDAIDDFDSAIALQPENSLVFYMRSLSKSSTSDIRGYVSDLQEAIRVADVDIESTRNLDDPARESSYKDSVRLYRQQLVRALICLGEYEDPRLDYYGRARYENKANKRRRGITKSAKEEALRLVKCAMDERGCVSQSGF